MTQSFSKIWILIILIILIAGGIFAWQYWWMPKEEVKVPEEIVEDETADWKIYRNEDFGFQIKYPPTLKAVSTGPNLEQEKLERGETISGTVQPSYDTISFSDQEDKEQFKIEIFHPYEKTISKKNYTEDYLYLFGACDVRWGFESTVINLKNINNNDILEVKGKQLGPHMETPTFRGCYYLKNYNGNLIVLSTADFDSQSGFQDIDLILNQMLSTFRFLK